MKTFFTPGFTPISVLIEALAPAVLDTKIPDWRCCGTCGGFQKPTECFICFKYSWKEIQEYVQDHPVEAAKAVGKYAKVDYRAYLTFTINGHTTFTEDRNNQVNKLLKDIEKDLRVKIRYNPATPQSMRHALEDILYTGKCEHFPDADWARYNMLEVRDMCFKNYELSYWLHFGLVPHSKIGHCKPAPVMADFIFNGDEGDLIKKKAEFKISDYNDMLGLEFDN